jgi:hypothetical protein
MQIAYLLYLPDRVYRLMAMDPVPLPPALLRELEQALCSIRFGTVELVIHEGRVVQLERREKVRFEAEVSKYRK